MNYALSVYPLSSGFKKHIEESTGGLKFLVLGELRKMPLKALLKTLRSLGAGCIYLPLEDPGSRALLPILYGLAAFSDTRSIEVIKADLTREGVSRARAAASFFGLLGASVAGANALRRAKRELKALKVAERIPFRMENGRVFYLNANLWFGVKAGGSVGHISGVVNGFFRKGYDVDFASVGGRLMIEPSINFFAIEPPKTFGLPYEVNYYRFNPDIIRQVKGLGLKDKYSFIYQRMSIANYSGVVLSKELGIPLVLEYNGSEAWIAKNWGNPLRYHGLAVLTEEVCLKHAHLVVTISNVLRDQLLEMGVEPGRIVTYPNCIDPNIFDPSRFPEGGRNALRARYGIGSDEVLATFIGTFGQWHGVDMLAETIRTMIDEDPAWLSSRKVRFLLVGDGLNMPKVRKILDGEKYGRFVTLTGLVPQNEAPAYLAASDILLSPHVANADGSRFFGSPTKLFEYMAMGKGIIASDLDQIGEILGMSIKDGNLPEGDPSEKEKELAVLFRPGDVGGLARSIRFLVEFPQWRALLGRNAREEALSKYTWVDHVKAILDGLNRQKG